MKTSDLSGALLDYWIAKAVGHEAYFHSEQQETFSLENGDRYSPSTNWAQGGPLIEKYKIRVCEPDLLARHVDSTLDNKWECMIANTVTRVYQNNHFGETPLIAACRCLVQQKFDDEVPDIAEGEQMIECNMPWERIPQHASDPGYGPVPPELEKTNVFYIANITPQEPFDPT